jgi:hypothetical protein
VSRRHDRGDRHSVAIVQRCVAVCHQVFVIEQSVPEELEYDELDTDADHFLALLDGAPVGAGRG